MFISSNFLVERDPRSHIYSNRGKLSLYKEWTSRKPNPHSKWMWKAESLHCHKVYHFVPPPYIEASHWFVAIDVQLSYMQLHTVPC